MSAVDRPAMPAAEQILGELGLGVHAVDQHLLHLGRHLVVEELGLLLPDSVDHVEGEGHVHRLVTEDPVLAGASQIWQIQC